MARTDNDTWDLAFSVGATATMVAAGRARASRAGLIDDPFAEPLVRAVGIEFFARWASGELDTDDVDFPDAAMGHAAHDRPAGGAHPLHRRILRRQPGRDEHPPGSDPGVRSRRARIPAAVGSWNNRFRDRRPAGHRVQDGHAGSTRRQPERRRAGRPGRPAPRLALGAAPGRVRRRRPTAWAAEGLFGYLPPAGQDQLLDNITALSADGSQLVAEVFFSAPASREPVRRHFRQMVRARPRRGDGQTGLPRRPQRRRDLSGTTQLARGAHTAQ